MSEDRKIPAAAKLADEALNDVAGGQMPPQCVAGTQTGVLRKNELADTAASDAADQASAPTIMPWSVP